MSDTNLCIPFLSDRQALLSALPIPSRQGVGVWNYDTERFMRPLDDIGSYERDKQQDDLIVRLGKLLAGGFCGAIELQETSTVNTRSSNFIEPILSYWGVSEDVQTFCRNKDISQCLLMSINLINESFSPLQELHFEIESDPETEDKWVIIEIVVQGEVDDFLEKYDTYIDLFVSKIPWSSRELLCLSYNII